MQLKKVKDSYNDYTLEISFGQLSAIRASLEQVSGDPVADELLAELDWYLENVPGPGQTEEDFKAAREGASAVAPVDGEDVPVEMPPLEGAADTGAAPEEPPMEPEGEVVPEDEAGAEEPVPALDAEEANEAKDEIEAATAPAEGDPLKDLAEPPAE